VKSRPPGSPCPRAPFLCSDLYLICCHLLFGLDFCSQSFESLAPAQDPARSVIPRGFVFWCRVPARQSDLLLSCFPLLAAVCFTLREFGQPAHLGPAFKYTCLQFILLPACHQSWSCSQLPLRIFVSCQEQASSASCASSDLLDFCVNCCRDKSI
jgi:hypothetical protein